MRKELVNNLHERKVRIVKFLLSIYLVIACYAFVAYVYRLFTYPEKFESTSSWLNWVINLLIIAFLLYIRFVLIKKNLRLSFIVASVVLLVASFILMATMGMAISVSYILIIITILSSSIVLGTKQTSILFVFVIFAYVGIFIMHETGIITYSPTTTETNLANAVMYVLLIATVIYITKTGYEQIDHSYQQALDHAKQLEKLNKELDRRVKLRTKQLEKTFDEKAESIHSLAVIGNITKPLLHDLANPLSSIKGSLELIKMKTLDPYNLKFVNIIKKSVDQAERILSDGRNLMQNREQNSNFFPKESVSRVVLLFQSLTERNDIKVNIDIPDNIMISGMETIFERIVINIICNAIEELKDQDKKRVMHINGYLEDKYFILKIRDSGSGIPQSLADKIFEPDFSSKREDGHLGIGLPFVKSATEKQFGGEISVKSEVGKYTEFILKFKKTNDKSQSR